MCVKLQQLKSKTGNLLGEIYDLLQGLDFTNEEVETLKDTLSNKLGLPFKKKKNSRTSRTDKKKDNIVMWNIPVGTEKDSFCQDIVSNILRQHSWKATWKQCALNHRTNIRRQSTTANNISLLTSIYHVTQISNIFSEGLRQH